jgi:hypothetical protein
MKRYFYSETIPEFLKSSSIEIIGTLADNNEFL